MKAGPKTSLCVAIGILAAPASAGISGQAGHITLLYGRRGNDIIARVFGWCVGKLASP
jgi:hypothetical protein